MCATAYRHRSRRLLCACLRRRRWTFFLNVLGLVARALVPGKGCSCRTDPRPHNIISALILLDALLKQTPRTLFRLRHSTDVSIFFVAYKHATDQLVEVLGDGCREAQV